jgi:hypothetical protein
MAVAVERSSTEGLSVPLTCGIQLYVSVGGRGQGDTMELGPSGCTLQQGVT